MNKQTHFCECGDHAFAPATAGYVVLVSPEDAPFLNHRWYVAIRHLSTKVRRSALRDGVRRTLILAREILRPPADMYVDHINCDAADNRRQNLRLATSAQNSWNRRPSRNRPFPKGVSLIKRTGRFQATIARHGKVSFLGNFDTPEEAAQAYRTAAEELHGEFARTA